MAFESLFSMALPAAEAVTAGGLSPAAFTGAGAIGGELGGGFNWGALLSLLGSMGGGGGKGQQQPQLPPLPPPKFQGVSGLRTQVPSPQRSNIRRKGPVPLLGVRG